MQGILFELQNKRRILSKMGLYFSFIEFSIEKFYKFWQSVLKAEHMEENNT